MIVSSVRQGRAVDQTGRLSCVVPERDASFVVLATVTREQNVHAKPGSLEEVSARRHPRNQDDSQLPGLIHRSALVTATGRVSVDLGETDRLLSPRARRRDPVSCPRREAVALR
jgi:uncharacterized protein (DUF2342 family)